MKAFVVLVLCGLTGCAWALPLQPYVGGSVQYGEVHELHYSFSDAVSARFSNTIIGPDGAVYKGGGLQAEAGYMAKFGSVYLGYRQCENWFHYRETYVNAADDWRQRWLSESVVLGGRLSVPITENHPIMPAVGAGLTLSWAQARYEYDERDIGLNPRQINNLRHRNYGPTIGWLLEGGVKVATHLPVDFWLMGRIENYRMGDPPTEIVNTASCFLSNPPIYTHAQLALSLTATYQFRHHASSARREP